MNDASCSNKPLIFVVMSILAVALIFSSFSVSGVFAAPKDPNFNLGGDCKTVDDFEGGATITCRWTESVPPGTGNPDLGGDKEKYCQTCAFLIQGPNIILCDDKELQYVRPSPFGSSVLDDPTIPLIGPFIPLEEYFGDLRKQ